MIAKSQLKKVMASVALTFALVGGLGFAGTVTAESASATFNPNACPAVGWNFGVARVFNQTINGRPAQVYYYNYRTNTGHGPCGESYWRYHHYTYV
ncbi:hypothetical protein [Cryobacterium zongtaii]|uniref:hypothetical protein n=1 Tax=Cryobacterium zongtaii TaxID=1259217 RepID=UPI0013FE4546|nr:hypothetical protein [Cryobacterium zongtaii]